MHEREVTIDAETYPLGDGFMVIATQNPIEQQGTYPLPEAQLDRFLFKHILDYPSRDEERAIVERHGHRTAMPKLEEFGMVPIATLDDIREIRVSIADVKLSDDLIDYIVDIVRATREHPSLQFGASPRSATMLASSTRSYAALQGRDFAIPDDVKALALPALRHRVVLAPGAEIEGSDCDQVITQIVEQVAAPR